MVPIVKSAIVFLAAAAAGGSGAGAPLPAAKALVERLKGGGSHSGNDGDAFLAAGKLDPASFTFLLQALRDSEGDPREELARTLVAAGRAAHETRKQGTDAIRDPKVIAALVETAVARQDPAKEVCLDALVKHVPASLLAPHGETLARSLADAPDETTALAVAKAKPKGGHAALEKAGGTSAHFAASRNAMLLKAALGDQGAETSLLEAFAAEKDGPGKAALARELALAGTPATLRALGSEIRSPLVYETPSSIARSFRLDVMEALLLAFPEEAAFQPHRVTNDAGYLAAEEAVTQRLGVTLTAPRPAFLTSQGRPIR